MPTYTIIVQNDHNANGQYAVFNAPPTVDAEGSSPEVYTNAWISSFIPDGGNTTITTTQDFYAWVGTAQSSPAPGVTIQSGSSRLAQLGSTSAPGSTFPMTIVNQVPVFGAETHDAAAGSFQVLTDQSFTMPNDSYLIGLGKVNSAGIVSPVASILADNNMITSITPIMKFYVGTSSYSAGTIVNFKSMSRTAGLVDFSSPPGLGKYTAVVRHLATGAFNVQYLTGSSTREALAAVKNDTLSRYLQTSAQLALANDAADLKKALETLSKMLVHLNTNSEADASAQENEDVAAAEEGSAIEFAAQSSKAVEPVAT